MNWLKDTTQSYRRGFVEGESGCRNAYLLEDGATDIDEYNRGFADGIESVNSISQSEPESQK